MTADEKRVYAFWLREEDADPNNSGTAESWTTDSFIAKEIADHYIRNARDFTMRTFMDIRKKQVAEP